MKTIAELKITKVTYGGSVLRTPETLTVTDTVADDNPSSMRIQEGCVVAEFVGKNMTVLIPLASVIRIEATSPAAT